MSDWSTFAQLRTTPTSTALTITLTRVPDDREALIDEDYETDG